ncbi:Speckle-type POZ protein-like protein [Hordeum vulgare]|nr:Speckle-type POZ protein-like protein [Hordeum vulgare]
MMRPHCPSTRPRRFHLRSPPPQQHAGRPDHHLHAGSRYVLGDRLKIECAIDVCGDFLTFDDPPPTPSSSLPIFQQVG